MTPLQDAAPKPKRGDRRYRFGSVEVQIKWRPIRFAAVSDTGVCRLPNRVNPHLRELEFREMFFCDSTKKIQIILYVYYSVK